MKADSLENGFPAEEAGCFQFHTRFNDLNSPGIRLCLVRPMPVTRKNARVCLLQSGFLPSKAGESLANSKQQWPHTLYVGYARTSELPRRCNP